MKKSVSSSSVSSRAHTGLPSIGSSPISPFFIHGVHLIIPSDNGVHQFIPCIWPYSYNGYYNTLVRYERRLDSFIGLLQHYKLASAGFFYWKGCYGTTQTTQITK